MDVAGTLFQQDAMVGAQVRDHLAGLTEDAPEGEGEQHMPSLASGTPERVEGSSADFTTPEPTDTRNMFIGPIIALTLTP